MLKTREQNNHLVVEAWQPHSLMVLQVFRKNKPSEPSEGTPSGSSLTETQQKALQVLAKYESGAAGYDAVNQIGTAGGRGVEGFSGDITKMPQQMKDL